MGLKAKMYSYQTLNDPSHGQAGFATQKRGTGIQRAAVAKIRHAEYKAQRDHPEETYVPNRRNGSTLLQFYGIEVWIRTVMTLHYTLYHTKPHSAPDSGIL